MTDHPLLFSAPMVVALLEGRKTQTRRVRKPRWVPGDRIWVRENIRAEERPDSYDGVRYPAGDAWIKIENTVEAAERWGHLHVYGKKRGALIPAIHMPRWANRITLHVEVVLAEPLMDITEEDALAEGVVFDEAKGFIVPGVDHPNRDFPYLARSTAREMYAALWDVINGSGAWLGNPTIYATTFKVEQRNIDR